MASISASRRMEERFDPDDASFPHASNTSHASWTAITLATRDISPFTAETSCSSTDHVSESTPNAHKVLLTWWAVIAPVAPILPLSSSSGAAAEDANPAQDSPGIKWRTPSYLRLLETGPRCVRASAQTLADPALRAHASMALGNSWASLLCGPAAAANARAALITNIKTRRALCCLVVSPLHERLRHRGKKCAGNGVWKGRAARQSRVREARADGDWTGTARTAELASGLT
mmetsp:Transcript_38125/g.94756  ORF Transcript_38125/g.94756 Transcript_38125/m.94756 type:complete len:232 (+) Transcript_38125:866-1561(+)